MDNIRIQYTINTPYEFVITIVVLVLAIVILLWAFHKFCPSPLNFIMQIYSLLKFEFTPGSDKLIAERMNQHMVVLFFIITACTFAFLLVGPIFKQFIGIGYSEKTSLICFLFSLFVMSLAMIISPLWIIEYNRERAITDRARHKIRNR